MSNTAYDGGPGHVGTSLSGYLDGELTQQEKQRIDLHLQGCAECKGLLSELEDLHERMGKSRLSATTEDIWRENMDESSVHLSRGIGWILFTGGLLVIFGIVIVQFIMSSSIGGLEKFLISAVYLGLGALFFSVLRQRLIERKTDKYKDVEI